MRCILSQNSHVLLGIAQLTPGSLQKCHVAKSELQLAKEICMTHLCDLLSDCAAQGCQHSCGVTLPALQLLCLCPSSCLSSCYLHHMHTMQADQTRDQRERIQTLANIQFTLLVVMTSHQRHYQKSYSRHMH